LALKHGATTVIAWCLLGLPYMCRRCTEGEMPYLNCPSCGLTLAMRGTEAEIEHCPRCLAKARRAVGLFVSAEPRGKKPTVMRTALGSTPRPTG
jgi:hypothetical protein